MDLTDLPAQQLAGATLISIDAVIENNSSFQVTRNRKGWSRIDAAQKYVHSIDALIEDSFTFRVRHKCQKMQSKRAAQGR
jgi:hypothetical protein